MKTMTQQRLLLPIALLAALMLAACGDSDDGSAEEMGRQIDNAAERAGEQMEDARESMSNAAEHAGDKVESTGDSVESKTD